VITLFTAGVLDGPRAVAQHVTRGPNFLRVFAASFDSLS